MIILYLVFIFRLASQDGFQHLHLLFDEQLIDGCQIFQAWWDVDGNSVSACITLEPLTRLGLTHYWLARLDG
jgi:hypothetical protein